MYQIKFKTMKRFLVTIALVSIIGLSFAAPEKKKEKKNTTITELISIQGQIFDERTNETLVGVKVTLEETNQVTYTDLNGNYSFENLKPGDYMLTTSYISYESIKLIDLQLSKKKNHVNIFLQTEK